MEAKFGALIKTMKIKSLESGDKEVDLLLRFIPTDDLIDKLNRLHVADNLVGVEIRKMQT